ncbi:MAG TPA: YCF48-related protein [Pyrinomonadaceae bacterium]|nr:YCF48-related protein [Pyrinomonadaceae bacterium]
MRKVGSRQRAAGSARRKARGRSLLPAVFCFLFLLPTAHCLLPTAHAAGGAWARQRSGSLAWLHAVFFLDERRGWAAGGNGVLLSTEDGGATWRAKARPTEDALLDVYFTDESSGWLVCERSIYDLKELDEKRTYLLRTTDGGASWDRVDVLDRDEDTRLLRALFTRGGRGWAFGEAGALYATRDGGLTWARQRVPTRHLLLGGLFLDGEQGWLVGAGSTLLQTSDGGQTWNAGVLLGLVPTTGGGAAARRVRFTATSFVDRSRGWAVGAEGRVFATRDGGRTWTPQESNTTADLLDVKFLDRLEGWAAGASGTLLRTTDGGARWTVVPSGTTHALERLCFVGRTRGWAVGFGGTILGYSPEAAPAQRPGLTRQK